MVSGVTGHMTIVQNRVELGNKLGSDFVIIHHQRMEEVTAREKVMKKFRAIALLALTVRSLIAEELKMLYF